MRKLIIVALALFIGGCSEVTTKIRKTSVFQLRQLVQNTEKNKYSSANLFFLIGHYSSRESTEINVKVFANVEGAYRFIEIPIEKIRVVLVDSISKPTLQIVYYAESLSDEQVCNHQYYWEKCIITCSEEYLPEKLLPIEIKE